MKISVIGAGYAGLCTAVGLAVKGHNVVCVDIDKKKVAAINSGSSPIYEKGIEAALRKALKNGLISASLSADVNSDIFFIAVQTPDTDFSYVSSAAKNLAKLLKKATGYKLIVMKSTVLPGVTESLVPLLEKSGKKAGKDFGIAVNPEFLREGSALEDFLHPDRIVIGEHDRRSGDVLEKIYRNFNAAIIRTNLRTAEMIKYASNAFLAAKISFINDIGNYCKTLGIDTYDVAEGIGHDKRIGHAFLNSGIGFGGSCLPKDANALVMSAKKHNHNLHVVESIVKLNDTQPLRIVNLLEKKIKLKDKRIAVLGLAFKSGTDDIRDAPSIKIMKALLRNGATVVAYDPKAMDRMRKTVHNVHYAKTARAALNGADACLLLTEWPEFTALSDKDFRKMRKRIIIEGRRILDKKYVSNFEGVCW
jgi:UDPglucose 6-dehydrogenase